ncbi:XkdQ/YqbQ family protein [Paenibacillus glacialis]|uniref:XkdQ/YqbQ family protein n=1 Tax=Paenibacillus glacialis TaxID=494026 RepID=UPI003CCBA7DE
MKIEAIGDLRLRAGIYVNVYIERFGINKFFLVDECSHKNIESNHTMSLELRLV